MIEKFDKGFEKLKNRKGSSMPEAMIGFLIAVLASMVLVGVVTVSGNIMIAGEESLKKVYETQMAFDIFVHHDYEQLTAPEGSGIKTFENIVKGSGNVTTRYDSKTDPKTYITVTDLGGTGDAPSKPANSTSPSVSYCLSDRFKIFCFTTPPGNVVK